MLLSVVIPVYNTKKYLDECIGSVLAQSFDDLEIILVDDGSTDGSAELCDSYAEKHPMITAVHQKNSGASAARNTGLRKAKGDYIHFIDSDDRLANDSVYAVLSERALDKKREIVFFRRERFVEGKEGVDAVQPEYPIDGSYTGDVLGLVLRHRCEMTLTCPVNKIFLRSFLLKNDLFFTVGLDHEEDEWLPRVVACSSDVWFDKGVLYTVRNRPDSLSKLPGEDKEASRACSKIRIAATGIEYMEKRELSPQTMAMIAEYYWNYLADACADCCRFQKKQNRKRVYDTLRERRGFFKSSRYLTSRNRRILGVMFRTLGIRLTVKIIGIRYGK